MQVTIELTQEEYERIEKRIRIAIAMKPTDVANLSTTDQVLGRLCLAARRAMNTKEAHE